MLTLKTKSQKLDLVAVSHEFEKDKDGNRYQIYGTGIESVKASKGFKLHISPASDIGKKVLTLINYYFSDTHGLVLKFQIKKNSRPTKASTYAVGDVIGKLEVK